jgi:hypothetical protein
MEEQSKLATKQPYEVAPIQELHQEFYLVFPLK